MAKVAIVLTQGFSDWEYALIGGTGGPFYGLDVQYFAPMTGKITSMGGVTAVVSQDVDALTTWRPDVVVVIGGTLWETEAAPDMSAALRQLHDQGAAIAGICGGTLALARVGLLNDVPHTSNDCDFLKRNAVGYAGEAQYQNSPRAVSAEGLITAPGAAPVSFTAAVFEAAGVATEMVAQFNAMLAAEHG